MMADNMPIFRLLPQALETNPARVGPPEQPRSPARASKANMAVPPRGIRAEALLKVPGQRIPTEKPHSPQPTRPRTGRDVRLMHR